MSITTILKRLYRSLLIIAISFVPLAFSSTAGTIGAHSPIVKIRHGTSTNWSGYAAYGGSGSFTSVSANWTQPALTCTQQNTYSSYWVGLDGYNTSTVEQLGTEGDCSGGKATFYAWYEMYPKPGYYARTVTVHSGDRFSAAVQYGGGNRYTLSLRNLTTGASFSTSQRLSSAKRASAEVIVEAPYSGGILPLANFGTANFTNSLANSSPLGLFTNLDPITMANPAGMKSTPSAFDSTKQNFSVAWTAN